MAGDLQDIVVEGVKAIGAASGGAALEGVSDEGG